MNSKTYSFLLSVCLLLFIDLSAQKVNDLPRSTPESEGVSSKGIIDFLDAVKESKIEFHSFMFLRNGKVIAEGWWNPYKPNLVHTMYSVSKSFTSTAIGLAVSEKKLSLDDKVLSFFPEILPDTISKYLSDLNIKDLLTMSVGQAPDPTFPVLSVDTNWLKSLFTIPILYKPGTKFEYNSLATYTLSAIIQKVTGEKLIDYLRPRLFEPLGIVGVDWEISPQNFNTGGWGLRIKTEDMAKFGQLYLQKGNWKGKQLIPSEWISEATSVQIDQAPDWIGPEINKDSSDVAQGYGYQFWRCRYNAYRADGAFGQFIIVLPDQDAVIALTAETGQTQEELNLVWKHLLPSIKDKKLSVNKKDATQLKQQLSALSLPLPEKADSLQSVKATINKSYKMEPNEKGIHMMSFQVKNDECQLILKTDTSDYTLSFGSGKWINNKTTRHGPYLLSMAKENLSGLPPFTVAGSYYWKDANTIEFILRYTESPHTEKFICRFNENEVLVNMETSIDFGNKAPEIKGIANDQAQSKDEHDVSSILSYPFHFLIKQKTLSLYLIFQQPGTSVYEENRVGNCGFIS